MTKTPSKREYTEEYVTQLVKIARHNQKSAFFGGIVIGSFFGFPIGLAVGLLF